MNPDHLTLITVADTYIESRLRLLADLLSTPLLSNGPPEIVTPWIFFPNSFPPARYGGDGHEVIDELSLVPPSIAGYRMYAGGKLELLTKLSNGESYSKVSRIDRVSSKIGKSGELTFVDILHEVSDDTSRALVFRDLQNLVYVTQRREPRQIVVADTPAKGLFGFKGSQDILSAEFVADASMLFRYSALTYNGHKIHLDRNYCREVESLPGLVVHGPLLATVGATIVNRLCGDGEQIKELSFRLHSTLFEDELAEFSIERQKLSFNGSATANGGLIITFEGEIGSL
ncbi:MAG: hypothetical protein M0Z45_07750 [Actinomycetota bacterium]|nr:hypothetical protein [Actinomycetota bacterium]